MSERELIPEGYYQAVAVRTTGEDGEHVIRFGYAGKNNTKQCLMYFELLEGPNAGKRVPWFGYFSKDSYKRTLQSLRYAGWKGEDLDGIDEQAMDQIVSVSVEHNTFTNSEGEERTYERIAWVNRSGGGVIKLAKPMSKDELLHFASQMRAYLSDVPEEEGQRAEARERNGNGAAPDSAADGYSADDPYAAGAEDDIPF